MLKKILFRLTLASALALGLSSLANASNAPGPYIGGQLGYGDTHTRVGDLPKNNELKQAGTGFTTTSMSKSSDTGGLAGRIFVGYQFNPNWAAEFGFAKFHDATAKGSYTGTSNLGGGTTDTVNFNYKGYAKVHAFDLMGKGILPLQNGFNVFGKLGVAYVMQTANLNATGSESIINTSGFDTLSPPATTTNNPTQHTNRFMPVGAVGVGYDITKNISADASWMHYQKMGGNIPNIDLLSLGLAYKFDV